MLTESTDNSNHAGIKNYAAKLLLKVEKSVINTELLQSMGLNEVSDWQNLTLLVKYRGQTFTAQVTQQVN